MQLALQTTNYFPWAKVNLKYTLGHQNGNRASLKCLPIG